METNKDKAGTYFLNGMFITGIVISLFTENFVILIFWTYPLVLFKREYVIPLFLLIPLLEGALNIEAEYSVETLMLIIYLPVILFDLVKKRRRIPIPKNFKNVFKYFFILLIFGTVVALFNKDFTISAETVIRYNAVNFLKIGFFSLFLMFVITNGLEVLLKALSVLTRIMPIVIIALFFYLQFFGIEYGIKNLLNFGLYHHGTFTATLVALSTFAFWRFFSVQSSVLTKIFIIVTILLATWIILSSGSRNGLLSLVFMSLAGTYFFRGISFSFRNVLIYLVVLAVLGGFIYQNRDSHAITRLTSINITPGGYVEGESVSRIPLWLGAFKGFSQKPFTGLGASPDIIRNFEMRNTGYDNVTHNTMIEMMLQFGILGLLVYFYLQFTIYKCIVAIDIKGLREDFYYGRLLIPFVSYLSLVFSSMFVTWVWNSSIWFSICLIFAIIVLLKTDKDAAEKFLA